MENKTRKNIKKTGFTIIELLVVVSLLVMVNGLILASLPGFNKRIGLKRTAGEIAIIIRQAQAYALGIKKNATAAEEFSGYGVHFDERDGFNTTIILFTDTIIDNKRYDLDESEEIYTYKINTGDKIKDVCILDDNCVAENEEQVDIYFNRASPFAKVNGEETPFQITLKSAHGGSGNERKIKVLTSGQIEIK